MIGRVISDDDAGDYFELEAKPNPDGKAIIHFDCEQSPFDADQVIRKALRRGEVSKCPGWLRSYCLTDIDRTRPAVKCSWLKWSGRIKTVAESMPLAGRRR